jgi:hypothetical protein
MIKRKGAVTLVGMIIISVCGWVAIVVFVIQPNIWVGSALSLAGGAAIGGVVAYLIRRWWFNKKMVVGGNFGSNENMIEGEMSDADFQQAVVKRMQDRVKKESEEGTNYGNDGYITVYREKRSHWGVPYELAVIRYFAVRRLPDNQFELIDYSVNAIGKHVVVEGERLPPNLRKFLGLDEFLYRDTLHAWQLGWPLKKQWEDAEKLAIQDCERLGPNLIIRLKMGGFLEVIVICGKKLKSYSRKLGDVVLSKWRSLLAKMRGYAVLRKGGKNG